jgi:hypothetical protein
MRTNKEFKHRKGHIHRVDHSQSYMLELDARMHRSTLVGFDERNGVKAALFHDRLDEKFTLLIKSDSEEDATLYDCTAKEQWGRTVMLFGHLNGEGKFLARGHGTLNGKRLSIKLIDGCSFFIDADTNAPYMRQFVFEEPKRLTQSDQIRPGKQRHGPKGNTHQRTAHIGVYCGESQQQQVGGYMEDEPDFSPEDLARLRGDLPV